ncbi:hypothetical protein M1N58_03225 [Dehalococcoidales bacterium]|nr:hypothetical protein [Dehalococcoidales bacterium]
MAAEIEPNIDRDSIRMQSLDQALLALYRNRIISREVVLARGDVEELKRMLDKCG